jgi:hypothetical protein
MNNQEQKDTTDNPESLKNPKNTLIDLAKQEFGELSEAEQKLFEAFAEGSVADYTQESKPEELTDEQKFDGVADFGYDFYFLVIAKLLSDQYFRLLDFYFHTLIQQRQFDLFAVWAKKAPKYTLDTEKIRWLLTDDEAKKRCGDNNVGLSIKGATICPLLGRNALDLSGISIDFSLYFENCDFDCFLDLRSAKVKNLTLKQSKIGRGKFIESFGRHCSVIAFDINIQGNLTLGEGFQADDYLIFHSSHIQGSLFCKKVKILGSKDSGFNFSFDDSEQKDKSGVYIKSYPHLDFSDSFIKGHVKLEGLFPSQESGIIGFEGSTIEGEFLCKNCNLNNNIDYVLQLNGIHVNGLIGLKNNRIKGAIELSSADIGGLLFMGGEIQPSFINFAPYHNTKYAIIASGINVRESIMFGEKVKITGMVYIANATIKKSISFGDCQISYYKDDNFQEPPFALELYSCRIKGDLDIAEEFQLTGNIKLDRTKVDGCLSLLNKNDDNSISLLYTNVGILQVTTESLPKKRKLDLDNFTYDTFYLEILKNTNTKIGLFINQFLTAQYNDRSSAYFSPQPYEQLAKVLRNSGREDEAIRVLVAKQCDRRKYGGLSPFGKFLNWILWATIRNGYRPNLALVWSAFFILVGSYVFDSGKVNNLMSPTKVNPYETPQTPTSPQLAKNPNYPEIVPFVYSIDSFIPIVDLQQKAYWLPQFSAENTSASLPIPIINKTFPIPMKQKHFSTILMWYFWLHTALGWIFTSLWVAGFTGLVRRLN